MALTPGVGIKVGIGEADVEVSSGSVGKADGAFRAEDDDPALEKCIGGLVSRLHKRSVLDRDGMLTSIGKVVSVGKRSRNC